MRIVCHQPCYLPWPGFFYKAGKADVLVLLDSVQFPRGTSWVNRNRVKIPGGQTWLTVPVKKKHLGLQKILHVDIFNEREWARAHFRTLEHAYKRSPFYDDHAEPIAAVLERQWGKLVELNVSLIRLILKSLKISTDLRLSSEFGLEAKGSALLSEIAAVMKAREYVTMSTSRAYLDESLFLKQGVRVDYLNYRCAGYPQLWGEFIPNLSVLDLLFNCGPKSLAVIERGGRAA